ncbi:DUF2892 domain-containing protein [Kineosporia sp. R_H_3]|uniref:YgaP family membrane protein n=1 Tax=Kineosporia sp. R_H_3 TaxID=1961848 RepID=UPI000B4BFA6B|nr:DUF2892 domain-containing protein [Kineosporia sp. R_H_3]
MNRPRINISTGERAGRVLLGAAGVAAGAALLTQSPGAVAAVLEVLLALAGLDLVVTGLMGHCPLYRLLGHVPASLRRAA